MSKKSQQVARLLKLIEPPQGIPDPPAEGTLLERGLVLVLLKHFSAQRAASAVDLLRKEYADWNEARVAQAQEIAFVLAARSSARTPDKLLKLLPVAREVKVYLQEVFQKTHGLSLEFLRDDPAAGAKTLAQMPLLGSYLGSVLLYIAEDGLQPITVGHIRVLDRLKLITRTTSIKKAREAVAPMVPKDGALAFGVAIGYVAERWCDSRKPMCWECQLKPECQMGQKVSKEWGVQQEKLTAQRAREGARRAAQEKREAERAEREAQRAAKRASLERQKMERAVARKKEREEAERKKKAASAKKKPVAKKPAAKKAGGKAPTKSGGKAAAKSTSKAKASRKAATKKAPAKKAATNRTPTKKAPTKKAPTKKAPAKKAATKKAQTQATRKPSARRKVARK